MHKAKLFHKLSGNKVQCFACQRYCQIEQNQVGFCLARKNFAGQLYSLNYGFTSGIHLDPIEKKPLYHFHPGTEVLSIGSWGCNFRCKQCLNWHCSWGKEAVSRLSNLGHLENKRGFVSPQALVDQALRGGYPGLAFTYNEPTIWPEYVYDTAKLAKEKDLDTVFVSNGSWSKETLDLIGPVIDAANIDFKGWGERIYQRQGAFWGKDFLKNLILAKEKYQLHLELTTLIIPGINDCPKDLKAIASWIVKNLGPEIPWHLSRFSPSLAPDKQFQKLPATPQSILEAAYQIGKDAGLDFVYVWATAEGKEDFFSLGDTYCPKCQRLVIKRSGWEPELAGIKKINNEASPSTQGSRGFRFGSASFLPASSVSMETDGIRRRENKGKCRFCSADLYLKI